MVKRQGGSKSSRKGQSEGRPARSTAPQVTSEDALTFIRDMQKKFPKAPRTKEEKEALQAYVTEFTDSQQLKAIGRRIQSDLMFGPPSGSRKKSKPTTAD